MLETPLIKKYKSEFQPSLPHLKRCFYIEGQTMNGANCSFLRLGGLSSSQLRLSFMPLGKQERGLYRARLQLSNNPLPSLKPARRPRRPPQTERPSRCTRQRCTLARALALFSHKHLPPLDLPRARLLGPISTSQTKTGRSKLLLPIVCFRFKPLLIGSATQAALGLTYCS